MTDNCATMYISQFVCKLTAAIAPVVSHSIMSYQLHGPTICNKSAHIIRKMIIALFWLLLCDLNESQASVHEGYHSWYHFKEIIIALTTGGDYDWCPFKEKHAIMVSKEITVSIISKG